MHCIHCNRSRHCLFSCQLHFPELSDTLWCLHSQEVAAEDQNDSAAAPEEDADTTYRHRDQDVTADSVYDISSGYSATVTADAIAAHHVMGASEITEATENSEVMDTGACGLCVCGMCEDSIVVLVRA